MGHPLIINGNKLTFEYQQEEHCESYPHQPCSVSLIAEARKCCSALCWAALLQLGREVACMWDIKTLILVLRNQIRSVQCIAAHRK